MPTLPNLVQYVRPAPLQVFLLNLLKANRRRVIECDGLRFFVDPTSNLGHRMIIGTMEPELTEQLRNHLRPAAHSSTWGQTRATFQFWLRGLWGRREES